MEPAFFPDNFAFQELADKESHLAGQIIKGDWVNVIPLEKGDCIWKLEDSMECLFVLLSSITIVNALAQ